MRPLHELVARHVAAAVAVELAHDCGSGRVAVRTGGADPERGEEAPDLVRAEGAGVVCVEVVEED